MRKLLNKPWFVAVMVMAAALLVGNSLLPSRATRSDHAAPAVAEALPSPPEAEAVAATDPNAPRSLASALKALALPPLARDPFALPPKPEALAEKAAPEPDFVDTLLLTALWTQNNTTFALINGHITKPGDEIGRVKFESATREGIWVSHWKGRDFVTVGQRFTLNTPAKQAASSPSISTL
jgi:hypothetical protein